MKLQTLVKIEKGRLVFYDQPSYDEFIAKNEGKNIQLSLSVVARTRTNRQNRALHVYFTLLGEALNDAGADMRSVIREGIDIPWTPTTVKEYLWRPVQEQQLGKKSTTELTTKEIDEIYDTINRAIGERTGVHVPFPCIQ